MRQVFNEHVDEFKHCYYSSMAEQERQRHWQKLDMLTKICFKRINIEFNTLSLQLVGSLGLPDNLREILV